MKQREFILHFDPEKSWANASGYEYIMNELRALWQDHMLHNKKPGNYVLKLGWVEDK